MSSLRKTVAADVETPPQTADIDITTIALTSALGGSALPFTFGHGFKQGDVPVSRFLKADIPTIQADVLNLWPDNSVKFAMISGRSTLSAGVPLTITLRHSGTPVGGAALTLAQLRAAVVSGSVAFSAGVTATVDIPTVLAGAPVRTHVAGAQMIEAHWRSAVGSDAHLVVWLYVRYYAGGQVSVRLGVENGYTLVAAPGQKSYTVTYSLGGSTRYTSALTHLNHTRWTRTDWYGTNPQVTPAHNVLYAKSTRLVLPFTGTPSAATLNSLTTRTQTPFNQAMWPSQMGNAGTSGNCHPAHAAHYWMTGDKRAHDAVLESAEGAGRYGFHIRDENTQRAIRFSQHPTLVLGGSTGIADTGASTANNYMPNTTGGVPPTYQATHAPSFFADAYLITGDWYHMESMQLLAGAHYLKMSDGGPYAHRFGTQGVFRPDAGASTMRGASWLLRSLFQALTYTPDSDTALRGEYKASAQANIDWYYNNYYQQNALGTVQEYTNYVAGSGKTAYAGWQNEFFSIAILYALQIGAPLDSDYTTKLRNFANWKVQFSVGRLGGQSATEFCYRNAGNYEFTVANGENFASIAAFNAAVYPNWGVVYTTDIGTNNSCATSQTLLGASGSDPLEMNNNPNAYWGHLLTATVLAVEESIPNAAAGWDRLSRASNFNAATANAANIGQNSVAPRNFVSSATPAHITNAAAGQWTAIGSNTLASVGFNYTGWSVPGYASTLQAIMNPWSGGAYDSGTHRLFVNGGGHNDYDGNETYAFNLQTNSWARLDNPSPYDEDAFSGGAANPNGWNGVYTDNGPQPIHTYDVLSVNPTTGKLYRLGRSGSNCLNRVQEFTPSLATQQTPGVSRSAWAYKAIITWPDGHSGTSAWMSDEGQFLIGHQDGGTFIHFRRYNPTTDTVSAQINGAGFYSGDMAMAYSPSRRLAALHRGSNSLVILNTATNVAALQTVTGATLPVRCGMEYDSVRDVFVAYTDEGADRRVLYSINPSTWVATQISPSAGATIGGVAADYRGIYGRFAYCADYDVYIAVNSVTGNVYLYKPTGWSPP